MVCTGLPSLCAEGRPDVCQMAKIEAAASDKVDTYCSIDVLEGEKVDERSSNRINLLVSSMTKFYTVMSAAFLLLALSSPQNDGCQNTSTLLFASAAYTSESMPSSQQQRSFSTKSIVDRPLAPPFPNGSCGGTVITLPRDLYGRQRSDDSNLPFLNFNLDPLSSFGNLVLPPRDVKVWLPKEYHLPEYRYHNFPVLYCHDGQNAMDDSSSWTGSSWRLIGALTRLSERKMLETNTCPIVVMIPCSEENIVPGIMSRRHSEYGDYMNPICQAHGEFVATKLHPYIKNRFRVEEEHISTIGSSLGGQASFQLLLRYPEIFSGAACMSPCFQPGTIAATVANLVANDSEVALPSNSTSLHSKRLYIDNGGDADDTKVPLFDLHDHLTANDRFWNPGFWWLDTSLQPMIDAMRFVLDEGGVEYTYEKFPGARHNERAWAQRIHRPLLGLYGKK